MVCSKEGIKILYFILKLMKLQKITFGLEDI